MFPSLGEMESHMFQCINQAAVHEELEDETRRLCDVRPFLSMLKLVTRNCGRADRLLDSKIGVLIGKGEASFSSHTHLRSLPKRIFCPESALPTTSFFPRFPEVDASKAHNQARLSLSDLTETLSI